MRKFYGRSSVNKSQINVHNTSLILFFSREKFQIHEAHVSLVGIKKDSKLNFHETKLIHVSVLFFPPPSPPPFLLKI